MPSTKNINQVEELSDKLSRAKAVYITEYLGLNVDDITKLRKEFHSNDVEFKVGYSLTHFTDVRQSGIVGKTHMVRTANTRSKTLFTGIVIGLSTIGDEHRYVLAARKFKVRHHAKAVTDFIGSKFMIHTIRNRT